MRILFDQGTPVPLREALPQHEVATAYEQGWSQLKNGELLDAAERGGFVGAVVGAINSCSAGSYIEVEIPFLKGRDAPL